MLLLIIIPPNGHNPMLVLTFFSKTCMATVLHEIFAIKTLQIYVKNCFNSASLISLKFLHSEITFVFHFLYFFTSASNEQVHPSFHSSMSLKLTILMMEFVISTTFFSKCLQRVDPGALFYQLQSDQDFIQITIHLPFLLLDADQYYV